MQVRKLHFSFFQACTLNHGFDSQKLIWLNFCKLSFRKIKDMTEEAEIKTG